MKRREPDPIYSDKWYWVTRKAAGITIILHDRKITFTDPWAYFPVLWCRVVHFGKHEVELPPNYGFSSHVTFRCSKCKCTFERPQRSFLRWLRRPALSIM